MRTKITNNLRQATNLLPGNFGQISDSKITRAKSLQPQDLEKAKTLAHRVKIKLIEGWERNEDIQIRALVKVRHKRLPKRVLTATAKIGKAHINVTSIDVYDSLGQVTEIPFEKKP